MKVICIDASNQKVEPYLIEGDIYNTVGTEMKSCGLCYELSDFIFIGWKCWAFTWRFIPLSSIDETEFVRNYQPQTQPV